MNFFNAVKILLIFLFPICLFGCVGTLEKCTVHENELVSDLPPIIVHIDDHLVYQTKKRKSDWRTLPTGENVCYNSEHYYFNSLSEYRYIGEPRGQSPLETSMERATGGPPKFVEKSLSLSFIKSKKHFLSIDNWVVDTLKNGIEELPSGLKFNIMFGTSMNHQRKIFPQ